MFKNQQNKSLNFSRHRRHLITTSFSHFDYWRTWIFDRFLHTKPRKREISRSF